MSDSSATLFIPLYHWYPGYSEPENGAVPPPGAEALCGHVRAPDAPDDARDMREVDARSCMKCVRLRIGDIADGWTDDELRSELGAAPEPFAGADSEHEG